MFVIVGIGEYLPVYAWLVGLGISYSINKSYVLRRPSDRPCVMVCMGIVTSFADFFIFSKGCQGSRNKSTHSMNFLIPTNMKMLAVIYIK